jgi:predicted short-subunit dehydrogenase-like oxidoreductase (DUF2520 family)
MIGFVGWGHVGRALGHYLLNCGIEKVCFFDTEPTEVDALYRKRQLIEQIPTLDELIDRCSIVFITVPDDFIRSVSQAIAEGSGALEGKLFIHTSGAHSIELLEALRPKTVELASIHPLMAFNDHDLAVKALKNAYLTVEKQSESKRLAGLLKMMGNKILLVDSDKKTLYHAGACVLSNYLTVVLSYGLQMMENATGQSETEVLEATLPLVLSSLDNVKTLGAGNALTGPLKRQDVQTIQKHYAVLGTGPESEFYHQLVAATRRYMDAFDYPHERLDQEM